MTSFHIRTYKDEYSRFSDLDEKGLITDKAYKLITRIPKLSVAPNVSITLTKEDILQVGKSHLAVFSRDYSCLIKHNFIKKIEKVYVVSPYLFFCGKMYHEPVAKIKWDLGLRWNSVDLKRKSNGFNVKVKGRVKKGSRKCEPHEYSGTSVPQ
jgi:hypothetical protein